MADMKLKKEELVELANEQEVKIKEYEDKLKNVESDFEKKLNEMKEMLLAQMSANIPQVPQRVTLDDSRNRDVYITSHAIGKLHVSVDKDSTVLFSDYDDSEPLSYRDVKSILKSHKNKKLFTSGILTFDEDEDYEEFKIKSVKRIDDEYLVNLFKMSYEKIIEELKQSTQNKTIGCVVHTIIFRSAKLWKLGMLPNLTKDAMDAFKDFFGTSLFDVQLFEE